ncbi:hypothetical protein ABPG75_010702 [Micractinium tetrahymenae]
MGNRLGVQAPASTAAEGEQAVPAPAPPAAASAQGPIGRLPSDADLSKLEEAVGYTFKDKWVLCQALIHPSFGVLNNLRLTWLGDAVLGAAVSDLLFAALPEAPVGTLHDCRMALVRCEACAAGARRLGLQDLMVVGRGYEGEAPTPRMLAEGYEAVWGAIYVDSGFSLAQVKKTYAAVFPLEALQAAEPAGERAEGSGPAEPSAAGSAAAAQPVTIGPT